jgi:hypothetical protein
MLRNNIIIALEHAEIFHNGSIPLIWIFETPGGRLDLTVRFPLFKEFTLEDY